MSKPNHKDPDLGGYLGSLSDQLEDDYGPGSYCVEFLGGGCKNYSYRVARRGNLNDIKTVIKVRGISINGTCSDIVTHERLRDMIQGRKDSTVVTVPSHIARLKWKIVTKPTQKLWRTCLNKRRRLGTETVPYGYRDQTLTSDDLELLDVLDGLMDS